jgi:uncharacterized protein (TIGR02246 family)
MRRITVACCLTLLALGAKANAQEKAPAATAGGAPDMSRMGPLSKQVTKEAENKKGVDALYTAMEAAWKKGDAEGVADLIDFPVIMMSDDSAGEIHHYSATREQWLTMMRPFFANMPKDVKATHKHAAHFLSDDMGVVVEDTSVSGGKMKGKFKSFAVVTLRDGQWKIKQMGQAGWGDMKPPPGTTTASMQHK